MSGNRGTFAVFLFVAGSVILASSPAMAYVGLGAGISLLGAVGAIGSGLAFLAFGLLAWPIRVLKRRLKGKPPAERREAEPERPTGE